MRNVKVVLVILIILSISAVLAFDYLQRVGYTNLQARMELHSQILSATAPSPYRYRVLVPWLVNVAINLLSIPFSDGSAFLLSYALYDFAAIILLLSLLFLWLRIWFTCEQSLIGVLIVSSTMTIALRDHYFQPWSLLESGLFTAGLIAIYYRRHWMLAGIVALASINRETGLFLPVAFVLANLNFTIVRTPGKSVKLKFLGLAMALFTIWLGAFLGLRHIQGYAPHIETISGLIAHNLTSTSLVKTTINMLLFLGILPVFVVAGWKYAPPFVRSIGLLIPLYLILILVWGVWYEVRLLMPLYPFLTVITLTGIYGSSTPTSTGRRRWLSSFIYSNEH